MRFLHVLDTLEQTKSIPRIAGNIVNIMGGVMRTPETSLDSKLGKFDVVFLHTAIGAMRIAWRFRRSKIIHLYHGYPCSLKGLNIYGLRHHLNEMFMVKRYLHVVASSSFTAREYESRYGRKPKILHYGVNTNYYTPNGLANNKYNFLYVGRLKQRKGVDMLLKSFKHVVNRHPSALLEIVGSGPEKEGLQVLAKDLLIEQNVLFSSNLSADELLAKYRNCRVYVSASRWEGFGLPLLEAMSCGKPCVVSDIPSHKAIIEASRVGVCVDPSDSEEFAENMIKIADESHTLVSTARSYTLKHSWDNYVENLMVIVNEEGIKQ